MAHYTDFRVVSVVGGQSIEDQGVLLRQAQSTRPRLWCAVWLLGVRIDMQASLITRQASMLASLHTNTCVCWCRKGCEIVVATPGRLVDCIERSYAGNWAAVGNLTQGCKYLGGTGCEWRRGGWTELRSCICIHIVL